MEISNNKNYHKGKEPKNNIVAARKLINTLIVLSILTSTVQMVSATVEPDVTTNPCDHGFIDFEDGTDGAVIRSTIPGVEFTTTAGYDWIYADWRTNKYNGKYPNGAYTSNGDLLAWLGPNQGYGRIDFTEGTGTYLSLLTSTASGLVMDAYDLNDNLLASSGWAGGNTGTGKMTRLRVDAPRMDYVLIHDTGNYWIVDDICTDAHGVRGVNLDISTGKTSYYPGEIISLNARVTDAYGAILYPLNKHNFKIFVNGNEVSIVDIIFENFVWSTYNLKIDAPSTVSSYSIEVVVDAAPGTESENVLISVEVTDSDNDGLFDHEEDRNHDGIFNPATHPDETNPYDHDTDNDGRLDNVDPYPWITTNQRKALVIGINEFDISFPPVENFFYPDGSGHSYYNKKMAEYFRELGFDVHSHIDEELDGDVITYDDVTGYVTDFANTLDSEDVAAVYIASHGENFLTDKYWLVYGDGLYSEDALYPGDTRHVTGQLDDIGTYLDFLWLATCDSWSYRDELTNLGAGGIIFFSGDGDTVPGAEDDFRDAILAERFVENSIDNLPQAKNWRMKDNYPSYSQNSGFMDLMNPLLTHKSPVVHVVEPEDIEQTPNESFASVNYNIWDSDDDSINDVITISWDANTVFPEDDVIVYAYVQNSNHKIVDQYIYGPYTIFGDSSEISSFNFYSTTTGTYNIKLMLYDSSINAVDIASINDINLNAGSGGTNNNKKFTNTWFDTSDNNVDGIDDTIKISWNVDTTLPQEDISVLMTIRDKVIKFGPYTIYNSVENTGEIEYHVEDIGTYEVGLYLIDSNSILGDFSSLEIPIEVTRFLDTYADYGTDIDGNGQYDFLTVDVGLDVTTSGNYEIIGTLYFEGESIAAASINQDLNEGIQTIQLNFDGQILYESGIDGQYELRNLLLSNNDDFLGHRDVAYTTSIYDHTQFQVPTILFNTFNDYGMDADNNGLFEYLTVEANVGVALDGEYIISGHLSGSNGDFIVSANEQKYLNAGRQTIQFNFDGRVISDSLKDGTYSLFINAYDDNLNLINSKENAYTTQIYDHAQFETRNVILDWDLTAPLELILDQSSSISLNIINPSNRLLTNLEASLVLPSELDTLDATTIDIGNLEPAQSEIIEWTLQGINPGYGEITIYVTSPDIEDISITRGIVVASYSLSVEADNRNYVSGDNVNLNVLVNNENPEVSYVDLMANVIIQGPDLTEMNSRSLPYIGVLEEDNIEFEWDTTGKSKGIYIVTSQLLQNSLVLKEATTSFVLGLPSANQPPVAVDDTVSTDEDSPVTFNVTINDSDADGNLDPSSAINLSNPSHGNVVNDGDGMFAYTPDAEYNGEDSFTYKICDTDGLCDTATATINVNPVNDPPVASVDITEQTVQYSDGISTVTISASDIDSPLTLTASWKMNGDAAQTELPDDLTLSSGSCTTTGPSTTCTWTLEGIANVIAGNYNITINVSDGQYEIIKHTNLIVISEDSMIAFDDSNPVAVKVGAPGGESDAFSLKVNVKEAIPDISDALAPFSGDINHAEVSVSLVSVGPGSPVNPASCSRTVAGTGYDATLTLDCGFNGVDVNTYEIKVSVNGGYYIGSGENVLVVYDPSLGFTTGGGTFLWPETGEKTNFGYNMKYNKKGAKIQGNLLLVRHLQDGTIYRVKSNALYGLSIGELAYGWASFSGKATYLEPGWLEPVGNHEFIVYVEDHDEPGNGDDRFWIKVKGKDGEPIDAMSLNDPSVDNTISLSGGNIVVPHK